MVTFDFWEASIVPHINITWDKNTFLRFSCWLNVGGCCGKNWNLRESATSALNYGGPEVNYNVVINLFERPCARADTHTYMPSKTWTKCSQFNCVRDIDIVKSWEYLIIVNISGQACVFTIGMNHNVRQRRLQKVSTAAFLPSTVTSCPWWRLLIPSRPAYFARWSCMIGCEKKSIRLWLDGRSCLLS